MFKKIFSVLILLFICCSAFAQSSERNTSSKDGGWYNDTIKLLRIEQPGGPKLSPDIKDAAVFVSVDIVISIFCLWLALYFVSGHKGFEIKHYFWFLVALNVGWVVILFLNYFCWGMLEFLVLRLRGELKGSLVDFFFAAMVVESIILYIWLLARNFSLNFFGALGVLLVSQIIYFIVFFIFSVAAPKTIYYCNLINTNVGFVSSVRNYLYDVYKISSHEAVLSFLRFRSFHI